MSTLQPIGFTFALRDLDDVEPWGEPEHPTLHWFGLTDGWYDLTIGDDHLFGGPDLPRGVEYPVVRLWEDLIEVAPQVLQPIPSALAARVESIDAWRQWSQRALELDHPRELNEAALSWWWRRELTSTQFIDAPRLHMWRVGEVLHLHWHTLLAEPGGPVWPSPRGTAVTSPDAFHSALINFDRDLLAAMEARVVAVERGWQRTEIGIDVRGLRREHEDRAGWLEKGFQSEAARSPPPWESVLAGIDELERRIGSSLP